MDIKEKKGIIKWEPKFNTGIDRIDFEHKIFLELINSFKQALDKGSSDDALIRILSEIEKYAEFHFISEENFMVIIGYTDYKKHQIEHFELLEQFNISKFGMQGFTGFYKFIKQWFINHTLGEDMKIKHFIVENKISFEDEHYNISINYDSHKYN